MGQQASGGVAPNGGQNAIWNAALDEWKVGAKAAWKTVTRACDYTIVDLLNVTLQEAKANNHEVALDRTDLTKSWKLDDFVRIGNHPSHKLMLHVSLNMGRLEQLTDATEEWEAQRRGYQLLQLELPGMAKTVPKLRGGRDVYTVKVYSEECQYLAPIIRRCLTAGEVEAILLEVLSAGAESLNITICHQMLTVAFEKIDVVQEQNDKVPDKAKVLTSYLWVRLMHFKMIPTADELEDFFTEVKMGAVRERVIRKMRMCALTETQIERFEEGTGGPRRAGPKTDRYLRMMVEHAKDRPFAIYRFPNDRFYETQGQLLCEENSEMNMQQCCRSMLDVLRNDSDNYKDWRLLVGWETMKIRSVHECLSEGRRCKAMGDDTGFIKHSLQAVEIASNKAKERAAKMEISDMRKVSKHESKEALSISDVEALLSANKDMLSSMADALANHRMTRERFEDAYSKSAYKIIYFLEGNILPIAREKNDKETVLLCLQTLADYYRYLHVYIPSERGYVHKIEDLYAQCAQITSTSKELSPFSLAGLTAANNHAIFFGEVHRRYDLAAKTCRDAIYSRRRHITPHLHLSPSQTFNWHLLSHNLASFETFLVVLAVGYNPDDMAAHEVLDLGLTEDDEELDTEALQMGTPKRKAVVPTDSMVSLGARPSASLPVRSPPPPASQFSCLGGRDRFCLERARHTFGGAPALLPQQKCMQAQGQQQQQEKEVQSSIWNFASAALPAEPVVPPNPKPQDGMIRAVRRWIKSRPLHRWTEKEDDSDNEDNRGHRGGGMPVITQVRWIDHVEKRSFRPKFGATPTAASASSKGSKKNFEDSSSSSEEDDDQLGSKPENEGKVELDIKKFQKAYANAVTAAQGEKSQPPDRLHTFCVSCAVRVNQKHMKDWQAQFAQELDELARDLHVIRAVHVAKPDLTDLLECMDHSSGVIYRPSRVGAENLWPGDTLMMRGPLRGMRFSEAVKLFQDIKMGNISKGPMRIQFLRAMTLAQQSPLPGGYKSLAKILGAIPYTEVHHHFAGFRDRSTLKMRNHDQSLTKMVEDFNHQAEISAKSSKVTPCRLRNLSSIRNPIQAGTTGCD